jgi:hypothetical protein
MESAQSLCGDASKATRATHVAPTPDPTYGLVTQPCAKLSRQVIELRRSAAATAGNGSNGQAANAQPLTASPRGPASWFCPGEVRPGRACGGSARRGSGRRGPSAVRPGNQPANSTGCPPQPTRRAQLPSPGRARQHGTSKQGNQPATPAQLLTSADPPRLGHQAGVGQRTLAPSPDSTTRPSGNPATRPKLPTSPNPPGYQAPGQPALAPSPDSTGHPASHPAQPTVRPAMPGPGRPSPTPTASPPPSRAGPASTDRPRSSNPPATEPPTRPTVAQVGHVRVGLVRF